jgi:hypothetical protein
MRKALYFASLNLEGKKPTLELRHVEKLYPNVDKIIARYEAPVAQVG